MTDRKGLEAEAREAWQRDPSVSYGDSENDCYYAGYLAAAEPREKTIAELRARVAELEALVPKLVTHKEFEEYAGRWWLVATFGHYGDRLLIVPMNQPIPAPPDGETGGR